MEFIKLSCTMTQSWNCLNHKMKVTRHNTEFTHWKWDVWHQKAAVSQMQTATQEVKTSAILPPFQIARFHLACIRYYPLLMEQQKIFICICTMQIANLQWHYTGLVCGLVISFTPTVLSKYQFTSPGCPSFLMAMQRLISKPTQNYRCPLKLAKCTTRYHIHTTHNKTKYTIYTQ